MLKQKIIVGMSGGVDSSVTSLLLKQQGFNVTGVFMKNWEEDDNENFCLAEEDIKDAENICQTIGIEFKKINLSAEYWDYVFTNFLEEYKAGRTPNPDILCNKEIKFNAFLHYAKHLQGDKIATGHYVRKRTLANGEHQLLKGVDPNKDQSYFLYTLQQKQLEYTIFPIGELNKEKVRSIAKQHNFITHNKKDSTGICFIGKRKFRTFLNQYITSSPGNIHDEYGTVIGRHNGAIYYTLGQRQGLGIGGLKKHPQIPWFIAKKDLKNNVITAVQGHNHPFLLSKELTAIKLHWIQGSPPEKKFTCTAKIRHRQIDQICCVTLKNNKAHVIFKEPQRAITAGQSVVFYNEEICLGGGIII